MFSQIRPVGTGSRVVVEEAIAAKGIVAPSPGREVPMTDRIQTTLQEHFGFTQLRPGQQEVIQHLLEGHSAAAIFPTGGGKSLCYQLPALLLPGVTLVVSPLIALMKDQIDALAKRGVNARRLDSSLGAEEYREVMGRLRSGGLRLLYVAPERFNNERFRENLRQVRISLFAVDEAHCISEWGHNFRPDYLKLAGFAREFGAERILALTATATPPVLEDICRLFDIAPDRAISTGFYRPNLRIDTTVVDESERDQALLAALSENPPGAAIVYVTRQKTAEQVARMLADAGLPARAYHAGLKADDRSRIQEWFMAADDAIVVATIAFGMGVDKSDIRGVCHYNLPKSLENYSQEIGRAGRNGAPSICRMLVCLDDLNVLENFIYGDTPDESALHSLIGELFSLGEEFDVSLYTLSAEHDIRPLVLRTLLTYLELAGYLQSGTPFYANYQFRPLLSSTKILARFEGERRDFLAALFRQAVKGRTWFNLDLAQAVTDPGHDTRANRAGPGLARGTATAGSEGCRYPTPLPAAAATGLRRATSHGAAPANPRAGAGGNPPPATGARPDRPGWLPDQRPRCPLRRTAGTTLRTLQLVPAGKERGPATPFAGDQRGFLAGGIRSATEAGGGADITPPVDPVSLWRHITPAEPRQTERSCAIRQPGESSLRRCAGQDRAGIDVMDAC